MDSLSDHVSRRSRGGRGSPRTGGATYAINRILLLAGALLFINGISITFIAVLIPFAINSVIVITLVTVLTAVAYGVTRNPERTQALVAAARPLIETLFDRNRPRRQGGL